MDPNQLQHDEGDERLGPGDLLVGADAIRAFLVSLGMPEGTDPYYLKRAGRWPIGNTGGKGGNLIATKPRLSRHANKISRGRAADDDVNGASIDTPTSRLAGDVRRGAV
jgi:hypothetical protein